MEFPFLVIATQNPVEQEGTYRLPEAQLDRFLFKIKLHYPKHEEEQEILRRYQHNIKAPELNDIEKIFSSDSLHDIQSLITKVHTSDGILKYIANITCQTREHGKLYLGASPRASLALLRASKALAALRAAGTGRRSSSTPGSRRWPRLGTADHGGLSRPDHRDSPRQAHAGGRVYRPHRTPLLARKAGRR
jgi:Mg-chelatase subunit ChlI